MDLLAFEIIQKHGVLKGLEQAAKTTEQSISAIVGRHEKEFNSAKNEFRTMGGFDDCGEFYRDSMNKIEGKLEQSRSCSVITFSLVEKIKATHAEIQTLKKALAEKMGADAVKHVEDIIQQLGESKKQQLNASNKNAAITKRAMSNIAKIITGKRLKKHISLLEPAKLNIIQPILRKIKQLSFKKEDIRGTETQIIDQIIESHGNEILIIARDLLNHRSIFIDPQGVSHQQMLIFCDIFQKNISEFDSAL